MELLKSPAIQSKLPHVGTTIFTVMSSLAAELKAINLGQGFPDFPMSEDLINAVSEAMRAGHNQYVHMNGYMPLRESIAGKVDFLYQANIHPETQVTITPGGTYAIYTALTTILKPGDEVIVFEPAYDSYIPAIELNGAKAITVQLTYPEYRINWEEVRSKTNEQTRAIIINSHYYCGRFNFNQVFRCYQSLYFDHGSTGTYISKNFTVGPSVFFKATDIGYEHPCAHHVL